MSQSISERRRRVRRAVTAGSAAMLAGAWGVVAVAGKGAGSSATATPAAAATDAATTADAGSAVVPSFDDGAFTQGQAAPVTSSQS